MNKIKRTMMIFVALSLLSSMFFSLLIPVAAEGENIEVPVINNIMGDQTDIESGDIIGEDISRRDEFTKYFITDKGHTVMAQYAVPIHYKSDEGDYVDYDNSLLLASTYDEATKDETALFESSVDEVQAEIFVNKQSDSKVSFYKKSGKNTLTQVSGNYPISWSYLGSNVVSGKKQNKNTSNRSNNDKYLNLENLTGSVLYKDIYKNIDLESVSTTIGIKENIILKAANARNKFKIKYNIGALIAESVDNKTIELRDASGCLIYAITAPFMIDSNGKESYEIELKIISQHKGVLSVELNADKKWLNEKERAFPVVIDPALKYKSTPSEVSCTFIESVQPSVPNGNEWYVYAGTFIDDEENRSLVKIENLPKLSNGDMIVNATANFALYPENLCNTSYVGVYEINKTWEQNDVTWDSFIEENSEGYDPNLIDYEKFTAGQKECWVDWDITELVKKWYNGEPNNGFMLKIVDGTPINQNIRLASSNFGGDSATSTQKATRPYFILEYRNNKGTEKYWTYSSFGAGEAGTAYVNDYSGNLVFKLPIASTYGLVMPVSISFIYNSYQAGKLYENVLPYTGCGWRMNVQQTLLVPDSSTGLDVNKYPLVYTDEDGTEHYFKYVTENGETKIKDEDGLNLEVTVNTSSTKTIADEDGNKWVFNGYGRLTYIEDSVGNRVKVSYKSGENSLIESVTDGDGKKIKFEYDGEKRVTAVVAYDYQDDSGELLTEEKKTVISYDNNSYMKQVTFPNGKKVEFGYASGGLLNKAVNTDSAKLIFTYDTTGSKGVKTVQEYGISGSVGQKVTFDRSKYNVTVSRSSGEDNKYNTSDDILTIQQFDNFGRTISVYGKTYDTGEYLGAASVSYTDGVPNSSNSNINKINRVVKDYSVGSNKENLVKNHNMESQSSWSTKYWIADTIDFSATTCNDIKLFGNGSLKIDVSSVSGDARGRVYQNISADYLTAGKTYTLSAYVRTDNIVAVEDADVYGAVIAVTPFKNSTSINTYYSDHIINDTDTDVNQGFRRLDVSFTIPSDMTSLRIQLALRAASGIAYFDGVQLEESDAASDYNMLENASFERYNSNGYATSWPGTNLTVDSDNDYKDTDSIDGDYSFSISGGIGLAKNAHQDVAVNGTELDTYILSGWACGNAVPNKTNSSSFELRAKITYTDDSTIEKRSALFNTSVSDWQYSSFAFDLSDNDDTTNKIPKNIRVYIISFRQGARVWFDNLQLIKKPVPIRDYDSEGNLDYIISHSEQKHNYSYSDGQLIEYIDPNENIYSYTYNQNKLVDTVITQRGLKYNYAYDNKGNVTTENMESSDGILDHMTETSYNYSGAQGATYSVTTHNQNGSTRTKTTDADTGKVLSVVDDSNRMTEYIYYDSGLLAQVEENAHSVLYYYDNKRYLSGLNHEGTQYNFERDDFGNNTKTKVGSKTLSTKLYNDYNGYLVGVDYGNSSNDNNTDVSYTYDKFGNLSTKSYKDVIVGKNMTDSNGTIIKTQDLINNTETRLSYDTLGRLCTKDIISIPNSTTTNRWLRSFEYDYDNSNNLIGFTTLTPTATNRIKYNYGEDNLLEKITLNNGKEIGYAYDGLGRTQSITINTSTPIVSAYTYTNSARSNQNEIYTTNLVETEVVAGSVYSYVYDDKGNIKQVKKDGDVIYTFYYDAYGQLTSSGDYYYNTYTIFTYDDSGNLVAKKVQELHPLYGYPIGDLSNISCSYNDLEWRDLLTSYDGDIITYDSIGNPINYRDNIHFTWENGRELSTFINDEIEVSYTYDVGSLRTAKTVTDANNLTVKYNYVYENGLLMQMTRGSRILDFTYDTAGNPVSVAYRSNTTATPVYYYYGTNIFGDVISLYNSNGSVAAIYKYNAYGELLSVETQSGQVITGETSVAQLNPLRYRGYVYDNETGLYYLQSRYYDPATGRFINPDGIVSTGQGITGYNMFVYCNNNPISFVDATGMYPTYEITLYGTGTKVSGVPVHQMAFYGQIASAVPDGEVVVITKKQLNEIGFHDVNSTFANDLNQAMIEADIDSVNEATHFLAQIAHETGYGQWLTELGTEEYFINNGYSYTYRGSGYIHLSTETNYKDFSDYMGDPEILIQGADYVAENYPWDVAIWYWTDKNINDVISGDNVDSVTELINSATNTYEERANIYYDIKAILG